MLFPQNMSDHLCIDEVAISQGELYKVVTNAEARAQKGSLIAMVKGANSESKFAKKIGVNNLYSG